MSSAPLNGQMNFESIFELQGVKMQLWRSPAGVVIPFSDFQKYTNACQEKTSDYLSRMSQTSEEFSEAISQFQTVSDDTHVRHVQNLKKLQTESDIFRIAFTITLIVAVILMATVIILCL